MKRFYILIQNLKFCCLKNKAVKYIIFNLIINNGKKYYERVMYLGDVQEF